ncbi:hypothetical protein ABVT39_010403 [Epinephelus coioides]
MPERKGNLPGYIKPRSQGPVNGENERYKWFGPYKIPNQEWSSDKEQLLEFCTTDIFAYLVCSVSAYTSEQFLSYKSLESHVQFTNGWVQELQIFKPANNVNTVIRSKVELTYLLPYGILTSFSSLSPLDATQLLRLFTFVKLPVAINMAATSMVTSLRPFPIVH